MSTPSTRTTLFNSLEKEFCPTLDSSLIAALLVEIESDIEGNSVKPTQDQIDFLRSTLSELSLHAQEAQDSELSDIHLTSYHDETISSWTTPDIGPEVSGLLFTGSSGSSMSSLQSFGSPLGFLQAALPEVPTARLSEALEESGKIDIDMWDIVANILTQESIREMEERGWDGLEEQDSFDDIPEEDDWQTIETKKKIRTKSEKKKIHPRPKKIALADIRQQHRLHSHSSLKSTGLPTKHPPKDVSADPWTQLTSLSDHLATLLPPNPPSLFLSFFHSPDHGRLYDALRAALTSLCKTHEADYAQHTTILYNILDVVLPEYDYDGSEMDKRSQIISDVQLAVAVTQGKGDESLDLINVLRDLDTNSDMGISHSQVTEAWANRRPTASPTPTSLPSGPPPLEPPRVSRVKQKPPLSSPLEKKLSPFQWQAVPHRKSIVREPHSLAHHIPAYTRDVNGKKMPRASGTKVSSESDDTEFRYRMNETMQKRKEALREAARMWQRGNSKSRGGEIAFYFAERAREFQEIARQEQLNAARDMVLQKRSNSQNRNTIDLHGTTVAEAVVIVKEILKNESHYISQSKPLKIITGRGTHSLNQVSVLKPAVHKALVEDGWSVGTWDGGLTVRPRIF